VINVITAEARETLAADRNYRLIRVTLFSELVQSAALPQLKLKWEIVFVLVRTLWSVSKFFSVSRA
jgi:hypothetical protein